MVRSWAKTSSALEISKATSRAANLRQLYTWQSKASRYDCARQAGANREGYFSRDDRGWRWRALRFPAFRSWRRPGRNSGGSGGGS